MFITQITLCKFLCYYQIISQEYYATNATNQYKQSIHTHNSLCHFTEYIGQLINSIHKQSINTDFLLNSLNVNIKNTIIIRVHIAE